MRSLIRVLALTTALATGVSANAWAQSAPSKKLEISFNAGRVTLIANGVTLSEILAEWQRQGGSRIVNGDRLTTGPLTYEFQNVPEAAVMQSLLRNAAGVIIAPRRPGGPTGASLIEQVIVLPTSRPTTSSASVMTMPSNQNPNPVPIVGRPDDDIPPVVPIQNPATPPKPQGPPTPNNQPSVGSAGTSAVPGVIVAPVKPGTPVPAGTIIK
ncbi:MAG: hypothetical protein EPO35_00420 [Acidobacteria bacterium]|nr:MAG: hypothetical protein EPO35_00420 [Acidobacteriota bacterium]